MGPRLLVVIAAVFFGTLTFVGSASADEPTPEELNTARQLFAEALADEDKKRFEPALEKYKRVLKVKETAAIRFRLGATYEGLAKPVRAVESYTESIKLASETTDPKEAKTNAALAKAAQARVDALEPTVAHLAIRAGATAPSEIQVDGEAVAPETAGDVRVDPGNHVITASAPGMKPFRSEISLSSGGKATLPIAFEPAPVDAPPPPPPPPPPPESSSLRTVGIVTAAVGVGAVVGGVVMLALRSGAISDLNEACPGGACPMSRRTELQDTHDRATAFGPIGGVLLGAGVVAIGVGAVLYMVGGPSKATGGLPFVTVGRTLGLGGTF